MIDKEFLKVLACPSCKEDIIYLEDKSCFICQNCLLKFSIFDDIPDFLIEDAEKISKEEIEKLLGEK